MTNFSSRSRADELVALQCLRGLAAVLVVFDHAIGFSLRGSAFGPKVSPYAWQLGSFGVSIFFVISGLIMVHTTSNKRGVAAAREFANRRALRVVPLYWIATSLAVALLVAKHQWPHLVDAATSYGFVAHAPAVGQPIHPILGQGWTLNYEAFFYLLFSLMLIAPVAMEWTVVGLVASLVAIIGVGAFFKPLVNTAAPTSFFEFYTDPLIVLFGVGALLGLARPKLAQLRWFTPGAAMAMAFGFVAVGLVSFALAHSPDAPRLGLRTWLAFLSGAAVTVSLCERNSEGPIAKVWQLLGDASYSVYLFHLFAFPLVLKLLDRTGDRVPIPIRVLLYAVTAVAFGCVVHRFVEKPITRLLRRKRTVSAVSALDTSSPIASTTVT